MRDGRADITRSLRGEHTTCSASRSASRAWCRGRASFARLLDARRGRALGDIEHRGGLPGVPSSRSHWLRASTTSTWLRSTSRGPRAPARWRAGGATERTGVRVAPPSSSTATTSARARGQTADRARTATASPTTTSLMVAVAVRGRGGAARTRQPGPRRRLRTSCSCRNSRQRRRPARRPRDGERRSESAIPAALRCSSDPKLHRWRVLRESRSWSALAIPACRSDHVDGHSERPPAPDAGGDARHARAGVRHPCGAPPREPIAPNLRHRPAPPRTQDLRGRRWSCCRASPRRAWHCSASFADRDRPACTRAAAATSTT